MTESFRPFPYHPSITAARAVKVSPIAMPIHGVWPRDPSLRAWRTCRAVSKRISDTSRSRGARCCGASSGNEAGELCARERLELGWSARTAGARRAKKVVGFMAGEFREECSLRMGALVVAYKQRQAGVVGDRESLKLARQQSCRWRGLEG